MIGFLRGELLAVQDSGWILGVGSDVAQSCIGYEVRVPGQPRYQQAIGSRVELWIHAQFREDAQDLFGFLSRHERIFFERLLTVNGLGPRTGMGILSVIEPWDLARLLLNEDVKSIQKLPGVGKKTSERLVVELKDHMAKLAEDPEFGSWWGTGTRGALKFESASADGRIEEALQKALQSMGFKSQEVDAILPRLREQQPGERMESWMRLALQELHRGTR